MKFAIYHREREYAREMGDPKLAEIEAPSKAHAEKLTAHLGLTGTIAVPLPLLRWPASLLPQPSIGDGLGRKRVLPLHN